MSIFRYLGCAIIFSAAYRSEAQVISTIKVDRVHEIVSAYSADPIPVYDKELKPLFKANYLFIRKYLGIQTSSDTSDNQIWRVSQWDLKRQLVFIEGETKGHGIYLRCQDIRRDGFVCRDIGFTRTSDGVLQVDYVPPLGYSYSSSMMGDGGSVGAIMSPEEHDELRDIPSCPGDPRCPSISL